MDRPLEAKEDSHLLKAFLFFLKSPALIVGLFIFVTSCAQLAKSLIAPPKIERQSVSIGQLSFTSVTLNLIFDIQNPNSIDLPIEKLKFDFFINDTRLASNQIEKLPTLESKKTTQILIPIVLAWKDLFTIGKEALKKEIPYELKGSVLVKGVEVPFSEKKTFTVGTRINDQDGH